MGLISMVHAVANHSRRFWHWSAKWPRFTILFGTALAVIAVSEYALSIGLLGLSALGVISRLVHWDGSGVSANWKKPLKLAGSTGILALLGGFIYSVIAEKGDKDWSHLQKPIMALLYHPLVPNPFIPTYENWAAKQHIKTEVPIPSRPTPPPSLKILFRSSPLFTPERKDHIKETISAFRDYLIQLGFQLPDETPPIGVVEGEMPYVITYSGPEANNQQILIGKKYLDDHSRIMEAYVKLFFIWIVNNPKTPLRIRDEYVNRSITIFSVYYVSSYRNQNLESLFGSDVDARWVAALWGIRSVYGKDFTDNLIFYTFETLHEKQGVNDDFDSFLVRNIRDDGDYIVDNNFENWPSILEIIIKHVPPPKKP